MEKRKYPYSFPHTLSLSLLKFWSLYTINAPPRPSQVNIISSFFSLNGTQVQHFGSQTMIFCLKFMSFIDHVLHHLDYPIQYYLNSKILNPQFHAYHIEVIMYYVEKLIFRVDVSTVYTRLLSLWVLTVSAWNAGNAGKYLLSWLYIWDKNNLKLCQMLPSRAGNVEISYQLIRGSDARRWRWRFIEIQPYIILVLTTSTSYEDWRNSQFLTRQGSYDMSFHEGYLWFFVISYHLFLNCQRNNC